MIFLIVLTFAICLYKHIKSYESLINYDFKSISDQETEDIIQNIKKNKAIPYYDNGNNCSRVKILNIDKLVSIFDFLKAWGIKINLNYLKNTRDSHKMISFNGADFNYYDSNNDEMTFVIPKSYTHDIHYIGSNLNQLDSKDFKFLKNPMAIKNQIKQKDDFFQTLKINKNIFKFCRMIHTLRGIYLVLMMYQIFPRIKYKKQKNYCKK